MTNKLLPDSRVEHLWHKPTPDELRSQLQAIAIGLALLAAIIGISVLVSVEDRLCQTFAWPAIDLEGHCRLDILLPELLACLAAMIVRIKRAPRIRSVFLGFAAYSLVCLVFVVIGSASEVGWLFVWLIAFLIPVSMVAACGVLIADISCWIVKASQFNRPQSAK